jgi:hypothetical protein
MLLVYFSLSDYFQMPQSYVYEAYKKSGIWGSHNGDCEKWWALEWIEVSEEYIASLFRASWFLLLDFLGGKSGIWGSHNGDCEKWWAREWIEVAEEYIASLFRASWFLLLDFLGGTAFHRKVPLPHYTASHPRIYFCSVKEVFRIVPLFVIASASLTRPSTWIFSGR